MLPPLKLGSVAFATSGSSKDRDSRDLRDKSIQRKSAKSGLSSVVAKSWRLSQEWLTWSLLAGDEAPRDSEGMRAKEKRDEMSAAEARWKTPDQDFVSLSRIPSSILGE